MAGGRRATCRGARRDPPGLEGDLPGHPWRDPPGPESDLPGPAKGPAGDRERPSGGAQSAVRVARPRRRAVVASVEPLPPIAVATSTTSVPVSFAVLVLPVKPRRSALP